MTIIGGVAGLMAVLLLGTGGGPNVTATVSLYDLFAYFLLVVAATLALRVLAGILRSD
jgi:ubiquinone biosynthesis protein